MLLHGDHGQVGVPEGLIYSRSENTGAGSGTFKALVRGVVSKVERKVVAAHIEFFLKGEEGCIIKVEFLIS